MHYMVRSRERVINTESGLNVLWLLALDPEVQVSVAGRHNPSQEGYYNSINPLVKGEPHIFAGLHLGGPHIFTGLKYSGASKVSHTFFPVVQFIGLQYSGLGREHNLWTLCGETCHVTSRHVTSRHVTCIGS